MNIIDKILKNIKKISKKNVFNLSKKADVLDDIIEQEEQGGGVGVLSPQEQADINKKNELMAYVTRNIGNANPEPLDVDIYNDPQSIEYIKNLALNNYGYNVAQDFINRVLNVSQNIYQDLTQEETTSPEIKPSENDMSDLDIKYLNDIYMTGKADQLKGFVAKRLREKGTPEEIESNIYEIVLKGSQYALGEQPENARVDQRFNFFVRNPDKIPSDIKEILKMYFEQQGINAEGDLIDKEIAQRSRGGGKEHVEIINLLKNDDNLRNRLLLEISKLIDQNDESINNWVLKGVHKVLMEEKKKKEFTNILEETTEEGRTNAIEETGQQKRIEQATDIETPEEKQQQKMLFDKLGKQFTNEYLSNVVEEVKNLSDTVSNNLKLSGNEAKQNQAERLEFYINFSANQIKQLFSEQSTGKNSPVFDGRRFKNKDGSIDIPENIMQKLFKGVGDLSRKEGLDFANLKNEELYNIIKKYNLQSKESGEELDWLPNWWKLATETSLIKETREIGKLKQMIKDAGKFKNTKDPGAILNEPGISRSLYDFFARYEDDTNNRATNEKIRRKMNEFVQRTINQDDKYIKKLLNAGDNTKGGIAQPKRQFETDVNQMMPLLYNEKINNNASLPAIKTFLSLVKPHPLTLTGEKTGANASGIEGFNNTELYFNLIDGKVPGVIKHEKEIKRRNQQRQINEVKQDENLSSEEKKNKIDQLEQRWAFMSEAVTQVRQYYKNKDILKNLIEGTRKQPSIQQLKNEIEILLDKAKYEKGKNDVPIPVFTKDTTKKKYEKRKKLLNELEEQKNNLTKAIEQFDNSYYKKYANRNIFNIVYSAYLRAKNRIIHLSEMKRNYNIIKLSSNQINNIDDLIIKTIKEFNTTFFKFYK